jgi:uncharacterized protein (TIGR03437 family)
MRLLFTAAVGFALGAAAFSQNIFSVAGNANWDAFNVALDSSGNIYVPDYFNHVVYKVDKVGTTTTIAGTSGSAGYAGDGALATTAKLNQPSAIAIGADGSVYIAEYAGERIRKVAPNGIITTFAGTGVAGFSGDNAAATAAKIFAPLSMVFDSSGNLFFTDLGNYRIRKITAGGIISTVVGTGRCPFPSGDGGLATATDACPGWMTFGPDNSIYFTDNGDLRFFGYSRVRKVATNGVITTVAGGLTAGFNGDGGPATSALLRGLAGIAVDSLGNLYISDYGNARIRKVDTTGTINTFAGTGVGGVAGDGGPAIKAQVNGPAGETFDSSGNLYFADRLNHKIRQITPSPLPNIQPGVGEAAFGGQSGFSTNMYYAIKGTNLAATTRTWGDADFNGPNAPASLDGVSVTVNNKPAFIYYISPTQININVPDDTTLGPVLIQVKNSLGLSNVGTASRTRLSPALESIPQFQVNGKQYAVAYNGDFSKFIGSPNMVSGLQFVAPRPGDTIVLFALGCGPTNPATQPGVAAAQSSGLALPYQIKIGGVQATIPFGAMLQGTIGLYQFNVVVPNVAPGDQSIELIVDGISDNQSMKIVIGQ